MCVAIDVFRAAQRAVHALSSNPPDGMMLSIELRHRTHSLFLCQQAILGQPFFRYKRIRDGSGNRDVQSRHPGERVDPASFLIAVG